MHPYLVVHPSGHDALDQLLRGEAVAGVHGHELALKEAEQHFVVVVIYHCSNGYGLLKKF